MCSLALSTSGAPKTGEDSVLIGDDLDDSAESNSDAIGSEDSRLFLDGT